MNNLNQNPDSSILQKIINDNSVRRQVVKESHLWFFHIYFCHYIQYETANFQKEMFSITEDQTTPLSVIVAFRGSGKSTIITTSYPIWSILGKQQKKFVVILSQTQQQAKQHLANLRRELENNDLLKKDLGPFKEESNEWGIGAIFIPRYNARIVIASCEQSIRGMRHGQHRPDLILCDDIEDLNSTRQMDGRNKTHAWFSGEFLPLGSEKTKIIVVGNLLHEDSLLMRLKAKMEKKEMEGVFREYPIINDLDQILWKGRFKDKTEIEKLRKKIGDEVTWFREYMLTIISNEERVIFPEWIQFYDDSNLPENEEPQKVIIAVDLAVSQKASADNTAIVIAKVYGYGKDLRIYIERKMINRKMTHPETITALKNLNMMYQTFNKMIVIENNGYQLAMEQSLIEEGLIVRGITSKADKRTRLAMTSEFVKSGKIKFPQNFNKTLIQQITNFGVEKHDDLADAFSLLVRDIIDNHKEPGKITVKCAQIRRNRRLSHYSGRGHPLWGNLLR